jgi:prevent-host-death family protein
MTKSSRPQPSTVGVHEAKTHLSRLLERVRAGEEIIIERRGEPVARLVAIGGDGPVELGGARGQVVVHDDFDAPLPPDLADTIGA